jgi:hypothetical protein
MLGLLLATNVGRRLAPGIRCAYEHLLLALDGAGIATVMMALCGTTGYEVLALTWLTTGATVFWALRRYGHRAAPPPR